MINTYKWRATAYKYIYITDVNMTGPFIFNSKNGTKKYYNGVTSEGVPNNVEISNEVDNLTPEQYTTFFNLMVELAKTDSDCSTIEFCDVSKYYNKHKNECEEIIPEPTDSYIPKLEIESVRVNYDYTGPYSIVENVIVSTQTKEIIYYIKLFIPEGLPGEDGTPGSVGPRGPKGEDGRDAKIGVVTATATQGDTANVTVSKTDINGETNLNFNFTLPKGEKGEQGDKGLDGSDGYDAEIGNISTTTTTLNANENAIVNVTSNTVTNNELGVNTTNLNFDFYIPKGEKGEQGEQGPKGERGEDAKFNSITAQVIETLEPDVPASVEVISTKTTETTSGGTEIDLYDVHFDFKIPKGERGEQGEQGPKGDPGMNDFVYINMDGETIPGSGIYQPGSGITFTKNEIESSIEINSNTEATTVSDIQCSTDAPCEALGIWDNDVIPSGTTIQEILEKILCKETYPSKATEPNITNTSTLSNNGYIKTLMNTMPVDDINPKCTWKLSSGSFNSSYIVNKRVNDINYNSKGQEIPYVVWDFRTDKSTVIVKYTINNSNINNNSYIINNNFDTNVNELKPIINVLDLTIGQTSVNLENLKNNLTVFPLGNTNITHKVESVHSKPIVSLDGWSDKDNDVTYDMGGWSSSSLVVGSDYKYAPKTNLNKYTLSNNSVDMSGNIITAIWPSKTKSSTFNYNVYGHYPLYQSRDVIGIYENTPNSLYNSDFTGKEIIITDLPTTPGDNGELFACDIQINNSPTIDLYVFNENTNTFENLIQSNFTITNNGISHNYAGENINCWRIKQIGGLVSSKIKIVFSSVLTNSKIWTNNYKPMSETVDCQIPLLDYYCVNNEITSGTYVKVKSASEAKDNKHFKFDFPNNKTYTNGGINKIEIFNPVSSKFEPIYSYEIIDCESRIINGVEYEYKRLQKYGESYDNFDEFIIYFEQPLWKYCNNKV